MEYFHINSVMPVLNWKRAGHCNPSSQEAEFSRICLKTAQANSSMRPYLEKPYAKVGLVEWLKVKALSTSPSTTK
jgi:hypothetical protein